MVVASLPQDNLLMPQVPLAPQVPVIASELQPGTWDFAFLSSRAYILTTAGRCGSIEIHKISDSGDDSTGPTTHVASLLLPALKEGLEMHHFATHSSPFLGGDITKEKPFAASQENRIHLMSFHYGQQGPRFLMFIKNDFLLSFVKDHTDGCKKVVRWEDWGPDNTRFLERNVQFQWLRYVTRSFYLHIVSSIDNSFISRYVHGQRVVLPPIPFSSYPNPIYRICVLDFNVHPKRIDDPCVVGRPCSFDLEGFEVITEETVVHAGSIFENDVVSRLPYSIASRVGKFFYSGFLIDEERLIGMKVRILSL